MIYKIETEQMNNIAPLFGNWQESLIWSCHMEISNLLSPAAATVPACTF